MSREEIIAAMKQRVFEANLELPQYGLVKLTWGNVSEINRELGVIVIKPSGIKYDKMQADQMVVTDLAGQVLAEDSLNPSSDLPTHVVLYQAFDHVSAIVHTHSTNSVMWAQAGRDLPAYGTTHADAFYGKIPCTRQLTEKEVKEAYEVNTGHVIVETFREKNLNANEVPGVLVYGHGPFTWGDTPMKAVENSLILDEICLMAKENEQINPNICEIPQYLLDKHYYRKHGAQAYYGQG
ncbi:MULTISPECIES: L-ribulose-5-phosphate 4-epimerase [Enterococcus]|uniref:L-ribulose-5-phosphate 4-epimerase n=1 Tax=Enterococcus malodoratus ATCC 43197 TaxID=1158601 RepID=R2RFA8_9ENTE|nr:MULTISPECIES: L-ribulose-5-phosphate 4-epimerase [Enterococcus]EOH79306.1 L-ribulose-5-phosphate 4-epimerase [Enterococcus malodoratus ATCC 43197]EOT64935.1 L-ribulose-5-phosphate 4-epimerase [Enterococcus malodoratus ATCC 43197]SPW86859.1 L-ribulose-5-phosphate 4-epimerase [Enterococcus malodoratus]STC72158.1 L-ribulose-5-phosphate 4-epimerase [Enterococcus malodoratus]HCM85335.1 L-ribulose-5-phosphate 4-epimerase [Enterococcus sp.]